MRLICAWCGVTIVRPGYGQEFEPETSHGMCPACTEALSSQERGQSLQHHLDTIPFPVLLLDGNNYVLTMNAKACDALGKKVGKTETPSFGRVFDCVHSLSSEGCGRAIHCSGCAIPRSVTTTFKTGEPQIVVPATLSITNQDELSEAVLAVTTVKIGRPVVLLIE